jgi:hypothetical protein
MFRLHIDVPLGTDEAEAIENAQYLMEAFQKGLDSKHIEWAQVQYRLGNDGDRSPRNYLVKNENGHATTGKCRL